MTLKEKILKFSNLCLKLLIVIYIIVIIRMIQLKILLVTFIYYWGLPFGCKLSILNFDSSYFILFERLRMLLMFIIAIHVLLLLPIDKMVYGNEP